MNHTTINSSLRSDEVSPENWTVEHARQHFNVPFWGEGFYDIDEEGDVVVRPDPSQPDNVYKIETICQSLKARGHSMPALLRFTDILQFRVKSLCQAFNLAIEEHEYRGQYTVCYPIKVNQQRRVVDGIVNSNAAMKTAQVGLEAGSKPELMAVLAMAEKTNSVIVCNGYKDKEYIRTALIASTVGHKVYMVVEKLSELELILQQAEAMQIAPRIGVRAKLASKGESKWQDSGGDHSKFGLSASQILRVVERLKAVGKSDIFQLLHFHLGSQITSIHDIQNALQECARFYAELRDMEVPIECVDVGGGLGVDYEGTRSQSHCSVNYSLQEYANKVVGAFFDISEKHGLPHPAIITESGRALTAHHAVLIANVIDAERARELTLEAPAENDHDLIQQFWTTFTEAQDASHPEQIANTNKLVECFHSAEYLLKQAQEMFNYGVLSLSERAKAERIHRNILFAVSANLNRMETSHEETIEALSQKLASKFFVNFSIFQSLPDAWAIEQIFPILPLSGLNEFPEENAILQDITCDSDGMIKQYVNQQTITSTINLPKYSDDKDYLLGVFMVGAYQEILGDMHNLFGDTHTIDLTVDENGELKRIGGESGSTVEELLDYVDFDAKTMLESYKRQLTNAELPQTIQRQYLAELRQGIYGYCYLED